MKRILQKTAVTLALTVILGLIGIVNSAAVYAEAAHIQQPRDMSTSYIHYIPNPIASVIFVGASQEPGSQTFTIIAASPITGVERMLLEDNRLVLDIINATTALSGAMPVPPFLAVSSLRVSQFNENTTRVVFDLESGTEFSIDISLDRTTITLNIHQQTLYAFSFEAEEGHDTIVLSGVHPSLIRVQPGTGQLWFHMINTQLTDEIDIQLEGGFATHVTLSQMTPHTATLRLEVNEFTAHAIHGMGNDTIIRLQPATYRNISYSFEERTFRIPKTDGFAMHMEHVSQFDFYHQNQFVLRLPINASEHLGFGEILIADVLLHTVTVVHSMHDTQLIFNGNQIFTLDLQEDEEHYIIKVLHPRERYRHIVIIDPGHGGRDPGAVRNGIREADLNLEVTRKLLQLIEADGFIRAYTTRNSDIHLGENQSEELRARGSFGNRVGDIFISIHHNSARGAHVHGIETFYRASVYDDFRMLTSRNLADIMQRHKLTTLGSNDRGVRSANFAVLRYSTIPAALLELGFMSNPQELARMTTSEFQWQAAHSIYQALLESFLWVPTRN